MVPLRLGHPPQRTAPSTSEGVARAARVPVPCNKIPMKPIFPQQRPGWGTRKQPRANLRAAPLLAACGLALAVADSHARGEIRKWTATDGRTVQARLVEINDKAKTARFEREDGFYFSLQWSDLVAEDRGRLDAAARPAPSPAKDPKTPKTAAPPPAQPPRELLLKDVPMIRQKKNYCVPASATMIARFHGVDTDQEEVAKLSSETSLSMEGTYPSDMRLAMEKLGFDGTIVGWTEPDQFLETILPRIRRTLFEKGPIYISFKSGVFGSMGHGCVIVGYDDRREEMIFHNPWGEVYESTYAAVARDGRGLVFIEPPGEAPVADARFIERIRRILPTFEGAFAGGLIAPLQTGGIAHELVWCNRRDSRQDRRFAEDTARDDGRKILELAFERNPAVLIPHSPEGEPKAVLFVTRPPEGGARFMVREIGPEGWSQGALRTLGRLTRDWPTQLDVRQGEQTKRLWTLPMIELRPEHRIEGGSGHLP